MDSIYYLMNIFFTSDLHLYDKNILEYRGGFDSMDEYIETIIKNWNEIVTSDDVVYILGDISMEQPLMASKLVVEKLNGSKILVPGNHDTMETCNVFHWAPNCSVVFEGKCGIYGHDFLLSHIPVHPDELDTFGYVGNIHGHIHKPMPEGGYNPTWPSPVAWDRPGKSEMCYYNVNVEACHYTPVESRKIFKYFNL